MGACGRDGALGSVGPDAVQPLVEHFQTQTGGPRIRAAFVLGAMGEVSKPAVPVLVEAMKQDDAATQKRLADILNQIDPDQFAGNATTVRSRAKIEAAADAVATPSGDWPEFDGPQRNRICRETGLLTSWPEGGPKLLWTIEGLGKGFSTISIANGRFYTMGDVADEDGTEAQFVLAYDLRTQRQLWKTKVGAPFLTGPRCTPTIAGDRLVALGTEGCLVCLETTTGKRLWQKDLVAEFGGKMMSGWMYSESPLVDGDRVICTPGGPGAEMVALRLDSGQLIWKCAIPELGDLGADGAGYCSAQVATIGGTRQVIQLTGRGLIGVDAQSGKFLWGYNRIANNVANIPTPIVRGSFIFVSTAYHTGSALLEIKRDGPAWVAEEVYFLSPRDFQNHHGGMVLVGDHVYGGSGPNRGDPTCIDLATGDVCWKKRAPASGSAAVLYADENIIFRYDRGDVVLVEATPDELRIKGQFVPVTGEDAAWPHPVIFQGKLYLRHGDVLSCYDLRAVDQNFGQEDGGQEDVKQEDVKQEDFVSAAKCRTIWGTMHNRCVRTTNVTKPLTGLRSGPAAQRCDRCSKVCATTRLRHVPWPLQIAAFPLTGLVLLKLLSSLPVLWELSRTGRKIQLSRLDFFDRYCPSCLRRQVVCHVVVAIWAISFVVFLLVEAMGGW